MPGIRCLFSPSRARGRGQAPRWPETQSRLADLGWQVSAEAPARKALADALMALRKLGRDCGAEVFLPHAQAAGNIAEQEVSSLGAESDRAAAVERLVVGRVVFEAALAALRRLAHEHYSGLRAAPYTPGQ